MVSQRHATGKQVRLCLFGPSGSGKSSSARIISEMVAAHGRSFARIGIGEPLYQMQESFYQVAGLGAPTKQDQVLLTDIATHLRRLNPECLIQAFELRLSRWENADVVVNDDLRDSEIDYPRLRELSFRFVHIKAHPEVRCCRLLQRGDLSRGDESKFSYSKISPDYVVENDGTSLQQLRDALHGTLGELL